MANAYYRISSMNAHGNSGVEYASSRKGANEVAKWLRANGYLNVTIHHVPAR